MSVQYWMVPLAPPAYAQCEGLRGDALIDAGLDVEARWWSSRTMHTMPVTGAPCTATYHAHNNVTPRSSGGVLPALHVTLYPSLPGALGTCSAQIRTRQPEPK